MITELSTSVPPDELPALRGALSTYLEAVKIGADLSLGRPATLEQQVEAMNAVSRLLTKIQLPRWRLDMYAPSSN